MKKLLTILFSLFVFGCNFFQFEYKLKKVEYLDKEPSSIFIDDSDNGLIALKENIYKIEKLNIKKNNIYSMNNYNHSSFFINKNSDTIILNSSYLEPIPEISFGFSVTNEKFNIIKIENNKFFNSNKDIFVDSIENKPQILELDKNIYAIYYSNRERYLPNKKSKLLLKLVKENEVKDSILESDFEHQSQIMDINIDKNGNGWYFYYLGPSYFKYFSIVNFQKGEEKLKDSLKIEGTNIKNYLDVNGNGFILSIEINNKYRDRQEYYINKIQNFNKIGDKELIFKDFNEINDKELVSKKNLHNINVVYSLFINKDGNGILFMYKNKSENAEVIIDYTYFRQIKNFKVLYKEIKILNSNSKYNSFSINNKGNGLIILDEVNEFDKNKKRFIVKKLINYELQE